MFKRLSQRSIVRPRLNDMSQVTDSFREVISDLTDMSLQWNENIYPLLSSLPGGRTKQTVASRTSAIDPIENGLDGSQLYMDMAATPQVYNGLLHNGTRPKTIKEVLLDSYQKVLAKVDRQQDILDDLDLGATAYDDSELRNWILQLAGDTVSGIAQGATYNANNFDNAPAKQAEYSLHQRDVGVRTLIGVEAESYGYINLSPLFVGSNYLIAETDVVEALLALDAAVFAGGGLTTLNIAYENGSLISVDEGDPVTLTCLDGDINALNIYGTIACQAETPSGELPIVLDALFLETAWSGTVDVDDIISLELSGRNLTPANKFMYFEKKTGNITTPAEAAIYIGKKTADTVEQLGQIYIGRQTVANGGVPHLAIESYKDGASFASKIEAVTPLEITSADDILITAGTTTYLDSPLVPLTITVNSIELGRAVGLTGKYSDAGFQGSVGSVDGLNFETGSLELTGYAPTRSTAGIFGGGEPEITALYRDNIIKCKGKLVLDPVFVGDPVTITTPMAYDMYNVGLDGAGKAISQIDINAGTVKIGFLTSLPNDDYTITCGSGNCTKLIHFAVTSQSVDYFIVKPYFWNTITSAWDVMTASSGLPFDFHFTVV